MAEERVLGFAALERQLLETQEQLKVASGLEGEIRKAEERAEEQSRKAADFRERWEKAQQSADNARNRARSLEAKLAELELALEESRASNQELHSRLEEAEAARVAAEAKHMEARADLLRVSSEADDRIVAKVMEAKAQITERAEAALAEKSAEIGRLAVQAYRQSAEFIRDMSEAVQAYRRSDEFVRDMSDAGSDSFVLGFDEGLARVSAKYPGIDLSGVSLLDSPPAPLSADSPTASLPPADVPGVPDPGVPPS